MKKSAIKTISIVLSIVLAFSTFSVIPFTAFAEDNHFSGTSEVMDFVPQSTVGGAKTVASVMGDVEGDNILSKLENPTASFVTTRKSDGATQPASATIDKAKNPKVFDGNFAGNEETSLLAGFGRDIGGGDNRSAFLLYNDGVYSALHDKSYSFDATIDLGSIYSLTGFLFGTRRTDPVGDYDIYVSNDKSSLFSGDPIASYTVDYDYWSDSARTDGDRATQCTTSWKVKPGKNVYGRYVGIRMYIINLRAATSDSTGKYYFDRIRIDEIAVYGKEFDHATVEDASKVSGLAEKVNSADNIALNKGVASMVSSDNFTVAYNDEDGLQYIGDAKYAAITNGNMADTAVTLDKTKYLSGGEYVDTFGGVVFTFVKPATITNMLIASDASNPLQDYEIHLSDSLDKIFDSSTKAVTYTNSNNVAGQYFTFLSAENAKFVAIKINKGCKKETADNDSFAKLSEIAIFGKCEVTEKDVYNDSLNIENAIKKLSTAENLLNYDLLKYATSSNKDMPGTLYLEGSFCGAAPYGTGGSYNTHTTEDDLFDKNINTHVDTSVTSNSQRIIYLKSNNPKVYYENTYIDIVVCLKYSATVSEVFTAWTKDIQTRVADYAVYVSNGEFKNIFNNENLIMHVTDNEEQCQDFIFTPRTAKYIGIRCYRGINDSYNYGVGSSYMRMSELAVFGKYDCNYYDYSVKSNKGDFIKEKGTGFENCKFTYEAPLTKNGLSFKEWKINGTKTDNYSVEKYDNKTKVNFVLDKDTNVEAIYEDNAKEITSDKYRIDSDNKIVLVPKSAFALDLLYGMNNYADNLVVKNEEKVLERIDRVKTGMTVTQPNVSGSDTLDIVNLGDLDLNGEVSVTDIVVGLDVVLSGKAPKDAKSALAIDMNGSKTNTVSDLVAIRNSIINDKTLENYNYTDYELKNIDYKYMGRKFVKDDCAYLETTASGIEMNVNMVGDLYINASWNNNTVTYVTVTVDGEVYNDVLVDVPTFNVFNKFIAVRNIPAGEHKIGIYKQAEAGSALLLKGVSFAGTVGTAPEATDLKIEFVGDSITCGAGNLSEKGAAATGRHENGYLSYAPITARYLGADYTCISKSGSTLVNVPGMSSDHMPTYYEKYARSLDDLYFPIGDKTPADIVVVNLGTNDNGLLDRNPPYNDTDTKRTFFKESAVNFAKTIADDNHNGKDVIIIFAYGMMGKSQVLVEAYNQAVEQLVGEGYNVYYHELPKNTDGGSNHPNVEGDYAAAEDLSAYIRDNFLNK